MLIRSLSAPWRRRPSGVLEINPSAPLVSGLVALYPLQDHGKIARNLVGDYGHLTHSASGAWSGSEDGLVAQFGETTYWRNVAVSGTPLGLLSDAKRTYAAWVRTAATTSYQTILQQADSFAGITSRLQGNLDGSAFSWWPYYTGSTADYTASVRSGQWTLVVGTHDGTTATIYINGIAGTPVSNSGSPTYGLGNFTVGNLEGDNAGFGGEGKFVGVWNRCLSAGEVRHLYAHTWEMVRPRTRQVFAMAPAAPAGSTFVPQVIMVL